MEIERGTSFYDIATKFQSNFQGEILHAQQGNILHELHKPILNQEDITFYDVTAKQGYSVYCRGVSFVLVRAVWELFGAKALLRMHHSLRGNLYCELESLEENQEKNQEEIVLNEAVLKQIQEKMREMIKKEYRIKKESHLKEDAKEIMKRECLYDKMRLMRFRRTASVNLYEIDGFYDYFYGHMPWSTKGLDVFDLQVYEKGFLLCFPNPKDTTNVLPVDTPKKISATYMEQLRWLNLMEVSSVADLNETIVAGQFGDLVRINEALHEKKIAQIADSIQERIESVKVVLIAGPSSSGKTSFANRLCVQLQALGLRAKKISLDDYYLAWEDLPVDEEGEKDLESIDTLNLKLLNQDLKKIIAGEQVEIPSYNFVLGKPEYKGHFFHLAEKEILVLEGIHGLNDRLTAEIPDEQKYKIFISAITQLNLDSHNRISTTDSRLLRRMVRDSRTRGNDVTQTLNFWHKVLAGEEKNIFPYQENADAIFNSSTLYELSVLKPYAQPLLFAVQEDQAEYMMAKRMIKFLGHFLSAPDHDIPNNSLVKEFIGGSCFKV